MWISWTNLEHKLTDATLENPPPSTPQPSAADIELDAAETNGELTVVSDMAKPVGVLSSP